MLSDGEIADIFLGTCRTIGSVIDQYELDKTVEEVEDLLLDYSIERCPECEWWVESIELMDENDEPTPCDGCKSYTSRDDGDADDG